MADGPYPEICLDIYLIRFFSRKETCSALYYTALVGFAQARDAL